MRLFFLTFVISFISLPAFAAGNIDASYLESLVAINRIQLTQNPQLVLSDKFLNRKVVDGAGKVFGKPQDVIIGEQGQVIGIEGRFKLQGFSDRFILDTNRTGLIVTNSSFSVTTLAKDIAQDVGAYTFDNALFIKTKDKVEPVVLKDLKRGSVETSKGKRIGDIRDLAFNRYDSRLFALIVSVQGVNIAVPAQPYLLKANASRPVFVLTEDQADTLTEFLRTKNR